MPSGQMHRILGLWEKLWRLDKMENIESLTCIVRGSAAPGCSRVFPGSELQLRRTLTQLHARKPGVSTTHRQGCIVSGLSFSFS
mmetsp:Transcript_36327/g.65681  ORF Transcript_36327/g.65681 Transcript_36327/m.65681 type:complete len:84 (-) Transcript_36327:1038-1289(-)